MAHLEPFPSNFSENPENPPQHATLEKLGNEKTLDGNEDEIKAAIADFKSSWK